MLILNFSHPLTEDQVNSTAAKCGCSPARIIDVPIQLDHNTGFLGQIDNLLDSTGLTSEEWQTQAIIVNLPGLSTAAGILLAKIHGLCGHFPAILRLRPIPDSLPTRYEVTEIIDLQSVRDTARELR